MVYSKAELYGIECARFLRETMVKPDTLHTRYDKFFLFERVEDWLVDMGVKPMLRNLLAVDSEESLRALPNPFPTIAPIGIDLRDLKAALDTPDVLMKMNNLVTLYTDEMDESLRVESPFSRLSEEEYNLLPYDQYCALDAQYSEEIQNKRGSAMISRLIVQLEQARLGMIYSMVLGWMNSKGISLDGSVVNQAESGRISDGAGGDGGHEENDEEPHNESGCKSVGRPGRRREDEKFNAIHQAFVQGVKVTPAMAKEYGYRNAKNLKESYRNMCKLRGVNPAI